MTCVILASVIGQGTTDFLIPRVQGQVVQLIRRNLQTGKERCILSKPLRIVVGYEDYKWTYRERLDYEFVIAIDRTRRRIATMHVLDLRLDQKGQDFTDGVLITLSYEGKILKREPFSFSSNYMPEALAFDSDGNAVFLREEGHSHYSTMAEGNAWKTIDGYRLPYDYTHQWDKNPSAVLLPDIARDRQIWVSSNYSEVPTLHMSSSSSFTYVAVNERTQTSLAYSLESIAIRKGNKQARKKNEPILEYGYPLTYPFAIGRVTSFTPRFTFFPHFGQWGPFIDSTIYIVNVETGQRQQICDGVLARPL